MINGMRAEVDVESVLEELRGIGVELAYCRGDVGKSDQRLAIIEKVRQKFGPLTSARNGR